MVFNPVEYNSADPAFDHKPVPEFDAKNMYAYGRIFFAEQCNSTRIEL